jgi:hypothetical protein
MLSKYTPTHTGALSGYLSSVDLTLDATLRNILSDVKHDRKYSTGNIFTVSDAHKHPPTMSVDHMVTSVDDE